MRFFRDSRVNSALKASCMFYTLRFCARCFLALTKKSLFLFVLSSQVSLAVDLGNCKTELSVHCGKTPNAVVGRVGDGGEKLWVVFAQNDHVYLSTSADMGATYSQPVVVNPKPESIYARGENRPKIAIGNKSEIYVSWTEKTQGRYTGNIRFSRSLDGGKTFQPPMTVNNDGLLTSHRFDALQVAESGKIYLAWLDKRDKVSAQKAGHDYPGAALYFAVSDDSGASFTGNYKVADNSCECCRIATAEKGKDDIVALWRHIFPGSIRDHAFVVLTANGGSSYQRATVDDWKIEACPHHGPDMISAIESQQYHMVWFSNGTAHKGVSYGRYDLVSGETSHIYSVDTSAGAGHPQIEVADKQLYIVWKSFDGEQTHIRLITSDDQGGVWKDRRTVLSTQGGSDHPQLFKAPSGSVYLGWHSEEEGYRVKALD